MTNHHFHTVGSFLRGDRLTDARLDFKNGEIDQTELTAIEDEAIKQLVDQQIEAGLSVVTDGELRRSWWHLDFFWGLEGVQKADDVPGYDFDGHVTRGETARVTGKLGGKNHPIVADFAFTKAYVDSIDPKIQVKQTIPAPAEFYNESLNEFEVNLEAVQAVYPDRQLFLEDIAQAYREVIQELYEAGARIIQIDDCSWGYYYGEEEQSAENKEIMNQLVALNNAILVDWPKDLQFNTHVCRGNYVSQWFAEGAYSSVAEPLFTDEKVDYFFLEYDSDRAGGFEPLVHVPDEKHVVLGIVTSKSGELEEAETLKARIREAAQYHPLERLSISTQCGFSSTEEGNLLTEADQWKKVNLLCDRCARRRQNSRRSRCGCEANLSGK